jgi:DNA-binding PadR family transcriptional regulator
MAPSELFAAKVEKALDAMWFRAHYVPMRHVTHGHIRLKAKALSEPIALILASLADEPRHGYALLTDVAKLSDGRVSLSTGTLYGAIHRLLADGWIERFEQKDTSREKQAYRLTSIGRSQLESEMARLRHLARSVAMCLQAREG